MSQNDFKTSETIQPQEASPVKHHMSVLGIDIAQRLFHVVGMNERGQIVLRKRLARKALRLCIATLPPVLSGMEACGGAHSWARRCRAHHHAVKRMAPQLVKPYSKSNKNDRRDAAGIGEAVTRPTRCSFGGTGAGATKCRVVSSEATTWPRWSIAAKRSRTL